MNINPNHIKKISDLLKLSENNSRIFYEKSFIAGEFLNESDFDDWFENRLKRNIIFLSKSDYEEMCLNSLKALRNFAETDFGSSRQRDFNQKWADTTRGYLGEKALQKFLEKFKISVKLQHKAGELNDFIGTDIHEIKKPGENRLRTPKKTIGIKTTKLNGMWLDIPGAQFHHSDYHILIKLMLEKDHIFSFFKEISIFKDKLLKRAVEKGYFKKNEADEFFNTIPNLEKIPAYITGFVKSSDFKSDHYFYAGKKGRKHYTIQSWRGRYKSSFLQKIKEKESIEGDIKFQGIGEFSHDDAYIFNTGSLNFSSDGWNTFTDSL